MSRLKMNVAAAVFTAGLVLSPMAEGIAGAKDKGAEVQNKSTVFASKKLPKILEKVKGESKSEKVESMFGILKVGNGKLKTVPSRGDKRPPRNPDETIAKGGDCSELGGVMVTGLKIQNIDGGVSVVHFKEEKDKNTDHVVAYADVDGKRIYLDPQAEKPGEIKGEYTVVMDLSFKEAEGIHYREMGKYLYKKGKTNDAIKEFEKAVEKNPRDAYSYHMLGILYEKKGDMKKARKHYERALELDPENKTYQKNKNKTVYNTELDSAYAALEEKDYKQAKEHFENALEAGKDFLDEKAKKELKENIEKCEKILGGQ